MVKQHRCLKYLPTLANTNIYASSKSQGVFLLQDALNVSLSVQNSERALISLAGSFSRPLNALTYLANLAVNSFFSFDFTDFPAFPENLVQRGRTNALFFFPPASKTVLSDCKISLPKLIICGPPYSLSPARSCCGRGRLQARSQVQGNAGASQRH